MAGLLQKLFGDPNDKEIKRLRPTVDKINTLEIDLQALSEEELKAKVASFQADIAEYVASQREKVETLEKRLEEDEVVENLDLKKEIKMKYDHEYEKLNTMYQQKLDDMLVDVFAVIKNACRRLVGTTYEVRGSEVTWNIVPFDVQMIGGMVLHAGRISEMRTGEGKTFVATFPVILNALTGRGVHLITVNDYLAQRDAEWMAHLYEYLGLSVGVIHAGMSLDQKKEAYAKDITYGTNNEFGFDYLRDNMAVDVAQMVQRGLNFAIVDEVDSILIDEARTPLIISAPADESTDKYYQYAKLVDQLEENTHYNIDEKQKTATLNEVGITKMEQLLGVENIYTEGGFREVHHMEQALKAKACFQKDVDYVVSPENEIVIIDEFTGRMLAGRRYSEGLHQAIEAKENVEVQRESMTLATVTFQNLFRLYNKLAGMTGTAMTEAEEFGKIYKLEVIAIPTNRNVIRIDKPDAIFATEKGKYQAVVNIVKERHEKGQPILIGTISIEKSEALSRELEKAGIPHTVLNAKFHEQEAEIVAKAGEKGAVTIATNMAGRGTDIKLGEGVTDLGGLCIIGTERHESRRIDNQLRGRAGRQGDPGETQFYVSMDDDLMRIFGGDRMKSIMQTLKVPEDMAIENSMISSQIEQAQKKVENHHFDTREHIVKYDDVMNKHREIIYARRRRILKHKNLKAEVVEIIKQEASRLVIEQTSKPDAADWNYKELSEIVSTLHKDETAGMTPESLEDSFGRDAIIDKVTDYLLKAYHAKEALLPDADTMRRVERGIYLRAIDVLWMEHLENMVYLRQGVALRGYGQRDPLVEYKSEAFVYFEKMLREIDKNVMNTLFRMDMNQFVPQPQVIQLNAESSDLITNQSEIEKNLTEEDMTVYDNKVSMAGIQKKQVQVIQAGSGGMSFKTGEPKKKAEEQGRNDDCNCGSGKKYKKCHGKTE
ncbi:MAG: preprotein translocase subunit SecA [Candidatus Gracilibacteria bacterium]